MSSRPRLHRAWEGFLSLLPLFALASVVAVWLLAGLTIGRLEGRIPTHFDLAGNPDGTGDASSWWLLPAVSTGIVVIMGGVVVLVRWLASRHPDAINIPRKADYVRLPPEARARITPRMNQLVMGCALIANLVMLAIVRDTYRVATHEIAQLATWKLIVCLALMLIWTVVGTLRIANAVRRETAALRAETPNNPALVLGTAAPL